MLNCGYSSLRHDSPPDGAVVVNKWWRCLRVLAQLFEYLVQNNTYEPQGDCQRELHVVF